MAVVQYKNFSYLKGPKGDKGDKGDVGPRGPRGDKGDPGPRGPAGSGADLGIIRDSITATLPVTYNNVTGVIGFNSTGFATESYVNTAIANLVDSAPDLLNTLNEISAALGDNPEFINSVVLKTGATMTGFLTLSGAPTNPLHAVTKQYVDSAISSIPLNTDEIIEGTTNLYFTEQRARDSISVTGAGSYDSATGVITVVGGVTSVNGESGSVTLDTGDITEGTNLYFTDARARNAISVTGAGSYDSATGVITVVGGVTSVNSQTGTVTLDTDDITEGSNLYYTTARANTDFDTRLGTKSTTDLLEGSNLYYTTARANTDFDTQLSTKSTTDLTEGTNLYFTDSRARSAISVTGAGSYDSATGVITVVGGVTSVNSQTGTVVLDTDDITEGSNLYYTDARARLAISVSGSLSYDSATGVISYTPGINSWDGTVFDGGDFDGGPILPPEVAIDGGFLETYYNPAVPSDWSGTPPTTVTEALDRLAAVVKTLNGGIGA